MDYRRVVVGLSEMGRSGGPPRGRGGGGDVGGGEERDEPEIHWIIGGSPIAYHNCVVRADLAENAVDEAIAASVAAFRRHGVAGSWHVGPSMRPATVCERLLAHGFTPGDEP